MFAFWFVNPIESQSQTKKTIFEAVVADSSTTLPISSANAVLLNSERKSIGIAVTDTNGYFQLQIPENGSYIIKINALGYKDKSISVIDSNKNERHIDTVFLAFAVMQLEEVVVNAKKKLVEYSIDKVTVNVGESLVSKGSSITEVLQRSPGVFIDQNNAISLKGKPNTSIYIDGKPTRLNGAALASLLKTIQAGTVDKIEIMSNPPARYEAEGTGGIINIVTKKLRISGFNGSVNGYGGYGKNWKSGLGTSFNYKSGKLNFYLSGSYNFDESPSTGYKRRILHNQNTQFDQQSTANSVDNSYLIRTGINYDLGDGANIGFNFSSNHRKVNEETNRNTMEATLQNTFIQQLDQFTDETRKWNNQNFGITFTQPLGKNKNNLSIDADFNHYSDRTNNQFDILTKTTSSSFGTNFRSTAPNDIKIFSASANYSFKLENHIQIETGLRMSKVKADNSIQFDSLRNGNFELDYTKTNSFTYDENISAAYVTAGKKFKFIEAKIGLRAENTSTRGNSVTLDSLVKRNYFNIFPSVFLMKELNDKNVINASYTRRIGRPNYQDLNPFIYLVDKYNYQSGNPFLKASYTNSFELSYTYDKSYNASLGMSVTNGAFERILLQDDTSTIVTEQFVNLSQSRNYYINLNLPFTVSNWWEIYANLNAGYAKNNLSTAVLSGFNTQLYGSNMFKLPKNWTFEFNSFYYVNDAYGLYKARPLYYFDLGVKKTLLNNNLELVFNCLDIFNTKRSYVDVNYDNVDVISRYRPEGRTFRLSLSYSFGNQRLDFKRNSSSASEEEQNRIRK